MSEIIYSNIFKTKYRIVKDNFAGYEAQFRYWWMPFWKQINFTNTSSTIENAKKIIDGKRKSVVEIIND